MQHRYIGYPGAAADPKMPVKVLRGFKKFCAPARANTLEGSSTVSFTLTDLDVSK